MKTTMTLLLIFLVSAMTGGGSAALIAQVKDTSTAPPPPDGGRSVNVTGAAAPAKLPDDLRARFWRAQAEMAVAKSSFETAQKNFTDVIVEIRKVCGATNVNSGSDGEPVCQAPPTPSPAPAAPTAPAVPVKK